MKKILFVHHAAGWGGAPLNMINIINSLDKNLYDVQVLVLKDSVVTKKLSEYNIKYTVASSWFYKMFYRYYTHTLPGFIPWYRFWTQLICCISWYLSNKHYAQKELDRLDFDLVHLNSSVLTDWLKPSKRKSKTIIHIQEPLSKGYFGLRHAFFTNQMKKFADKIIAISEDNKQRLQFNENVEVVYNYTEISDLEEYSPEEYSTKKVIYLGGKARIKGFYDLVDALDYIDEGIKVYFLGYYGNFKEFRQKSFVNLIKRFLKTNILRSNDDLKRIEKWNMHKAVVQVGLTFQVNKYIDDSVCLISPTYIPHFSRPIIESFGRRKPVITSDVEGVKEVVENYLNGLIVSRGNPKLLAEAINFICSNPKAAKLMGDEGYKNAKSKYSMENIKYIERFYKELTS